MRSYPADHVNICEGVNLALETTKNSSKRIIVRRQLSKEERFRVYPQNEGDRDKYQSNDPTNKDNFDVEILSAREICGYTLFCKQLSFENQRPVLLEEQP